MGIIKTLDRWMQHRELIDRALANLWQRRLIIDGASFAEDGDE